MRINKFVLLSAVMASTFFVCFPAGAGAANNLEQFPIRLREFDVSPGETLEFNLRAGAGADSKLEFCSSCLPPGAAFDARSGKFSWTPPVEVGGSYIWLYFLGEKSGKVRGVGTVSIHVNKSTASGADRRSPAGKTSAVKAVREHPHKKAAKLKKVGGREDKKGAPPEVNPELPVEPEEIPPPSPAVPAQDAPTLPEEETGNSSETGEEGFSPSGDSSEVEEDDLSPARTPSPPIPPAIPTPSPRPASTSPPAPTATPASAPTPTPPPTSTPPASPPPTPVSTSSPSPAPTVLLTPAPTSSPVPTASPSPASSASPSPTPVWPKLALKVYLHGWSTTTNDLPWPRLPAEITVELRDVDIPSQVRYSFKEVWLNTRGELNEGVLNLEGIEPGDYYIVVKKDKYLPVMTAFPSTFSWDDEEVQEINLTLSDTAYWPEPKAVNPDPLFTEEANNQARALRGGDLDGDGIIGSEDYAILQQYWNGTDLESLEKADIDGDGIVFVSDYSIMAAGWGTVSYVPEEE